MSLAVCCSGSTQKQLDLLSQAADSICDGDLVDNCIRSGQNWSLLPTFVSRGDKMEPPAHILE